MKGTELPSEIIAVKTLCGGYRQARETMLASGLTEAHFGDPRTKETFIVIMSMANKRKEMPSIRILSQADQLPENARELITDSDEAYPECKTAGDAEQIFSNLERHRQARVIQDTQDEVNQHMQSEDADPEQALTLMENGLLLARSGAIEEDLKIGVDGNFLAAVLASLNETKPAVVPTGFRDFDERAGGLPRGGVTTLAANSGGGKSTLALQICINAYNLGYSSCFASLEMQRDQMNERLQANLSGVAYTPIRLKKLDQSMRKRILRSTTEFQEEGEKGDKKLVIKHFTNATIGEIAVQLRAFNYDIIVIDYINLLNKEMLSGMNEAAALGEIARTAKVQAGATNTAWIIVAQLNEQGLVKYSRAIKENSDNMLTWIYGEAEKESHVVEITQQKARSNEEFSFNLREDFKVCRFENAGNASSNSDMGIRKARRKEQRHSTAKPMPGLEIIDEEDDL